MTDLYWNSLWDKCDSWDIFVKTQNHRKSQYNLSTSTVEAILLTRCMSACDHARVVGDQQSCRDSGEAVAPSLSGLVTAGGYSRYAPTAGPDDPQPGRLPGGRGPSRREPQQLGR